MSPTLNCKTNSVRARHHWNLFRASAGVLVLKNLELILIQLRSPLRCDFAEHGSIAIPYALTSEENFYKPCNERLSEL